MIDSNKNTKDREKLNNLLLDYSDTTDYDQDKRAKILKEIFGKTSEGVNIRPPIHVEIGKNTYLEKNVYMNFNCVINDYAKVIIGEGTLIASGVLFDTLLPERDIEKRKFHNAKEIKIGKNVWIGGSSIICPGVTVGDNVVIGAGCVVDRDVEDNVVIVGNPYRVVKRVEIK